MACNLSDGKSPTFITVCSTARKRNTKLAEGWREGGKDTFPSSVSPRVAPELLAAAIYTQGCCQHNPARKNPFMCIFLPGDREVFTLLFSHYSEFMLRKSLTIIKGKPGLVEVLLFLLIYFSTVAPVVNKSQRLFYSFPAPERRRNEGLNALELPLLYSFLPPHSFYSLPGSSDGGNSFLTAPGLFSKGWVMFFKERVRWVPGGGTRRCCKEHPKKTTTSFPSIILDISKSHFPPVFPCSQELWFSFAVPSRGKVSKADGEEGDLQDYSKPPVMGTVWLRPWTALLLPQGDAFCWTVAELTAWTQNILSSCCWNTRRTDPCSAPLNDPSPAQQCLGIAESLQAAHAKRKKTCHL